MCVEVEVDVAVTKSRQFVTVAVVTGAVVVVAVVVVTVALWFVLASVVVVVRQSCPLSKSFRHQEVVESVVQVEVAVAVTVVVEVVRQVKVCCVDVASASQK